MTYSKRFDEALAFASEIHREQMRRGKEVPYINHLMAVASIVGSNGGDEDQVIAALLHDAIEDCIDEVPEIREEIGERFGEQVLEIVEGCTDADTYPKPPWPERKEAYLDHLRELPDDSPVLLVSLADKVHNARSILRDLREVGSELWERFKGKHGGTIWYYNTLATIFEEKRPGPLADELRRVVEAIKEEGGVPEILAGPETDNTLLVEQLRGRLSEGFDLHDALDFIIVESHEHWDFIAEISPHDLSVHVWLTVLPGESVAAGEDETEAEFARRFEEEAQALLDRELGAWAERGFEPAREGELTSAERAKPIEGDGGLAYTQKLVSVADTLDEVVEMVDFIETRGVDRRVGDAQTE